MKSDPCRSIAAEELVRAAREAFRPTDEDRERVFLALVPRIGGGAGAGEVQVRSQTTLSSTVLAKVSAVLVGLGVAGAGALLVSPNEPRLVARAHLAMPALRVPVVAVPNTPSSAGAVVTPSEREAERKRSLARTASADDLAREVAILSRAGAELHAGRPSAALEQLAEHQRIFPRGALAQERSAARIQALCALERKTEARAELAQLEKASPNSPHEARARKACGFGSHTAPD